MVIFVLAVDSAGCGGARAKLAAEGLALLDPFDADGLEAVEPCNFSRRLLRIYHIVGYQNIVKQMDSVLTCSIFSASGASGVSRALFAGGGGFSILTLLLWL
jgi:hypothetical protein